MPEDRLPFVSSRSLRRLSALATLLVATAAHAQATLPWTPDPFERHALQRLVDEGGLSLTTSHWPLPRSAVQQALAALPAALPPGLDQARASVQAGLARATRAQASLTVRTNDEALPGFGDDGAPGSQATLRSPAYEGRHFAAQFGVRASRATAPWNNGTDLRLDHTAVVAEALGWQLQAWSRQAWWGPGWQDSLVLGHNTPPMLGVGFQRASASRSESPWLSWAGPWNFEFFVAQTDDARKPKNPFLIGHRLTLRPLPSLEIGLTRTAQWGGKGRDQSLRSFLRMLGGRGTNAGDENYTGADPGNGMAGIDLRAGCPAGWRCAGYAQLIGEDEANYMPSKFLGVYGLEHWSADGRHRWFAELAETGCRMPVGQDADKGCAYRNYAYGDGYTHGGRWIGAGVGADSRVLTLGWLDAERRTALRLHAGRVGARIGALGSTDDPRHAGHLFGLTGSVQLRWGAAMIAPELGWLRVAADDGNRHEARIGATITLPLDSLLRP